jgi:hypothetical protein
VCRKEKWNVANAAHHSRNPTSNALRVMDGYAELAKRNVGNAKE